MLFPAAKIQTFFESEKVLVCRFGMLMFLLRLHGVTQVKTTLEVGRSVPCSKAVRTAVGHVMVQAPDSVERPRHMHCLLDTPLMSK